MGKGFYPTCGVEVWPPGELVALVPQELREGVPHGPGTQDFLLGEARGCQCSRTNRMRLGTGTRVPGVRAISGMTARAYLSGQKLPSSTALSYLHAPCWQSLSGPTQQSEGHAPAELW